MTRKIAITIIVGFLYWLLEFVAMKLFHLLTIPYGNIHGRMLYFLIPFLLGAFLIIVIKEERYVGTVFSAMIIIVYYAISLLQITVRYPIGGPPLEATWWLFKIVGVYSMVSSTIGGITGIILNKKLLKK